ncbi:MAG: protein phosphatase 2C domain-containing protein [Planctomycetaceae bacterium]|nr:protein phosphatase 2C domain-containing protein [Planctomycetaceae bacterium]
MKSILYSAKTDIGLRRANNQDAHAIVLADSLSHWQEKGHLLIVADGMGAHAAGEVASQMATDTITMSYSKQVKELPPLALQKAVYDAHQQIREQSGKDDAFRDMGTTVDALLLLPQGAVIAHVGDSRVYRWRNQKIEQLTFDHSLVWEVCVAFKLPFDQAPLDIPRNQITRSLGPTEKLKVDLEGPYTIEVGDVFLMCSDGLSGQINDQEIGQILEVLTPDDATETLINLANLRGGPDNITIIVAKAIESKEPVSQKPQGFFGAFLSLFREIRQSLFSPSLHISSDVPYGNGPYTSHSCPPSAEFTEKLASILQQFRQVTQNNKWEISWERADLREEAALAAVHSRSYGTAIREYCLAINFLMQELKNQKPKKS